MTNQPSHIEHTQSGAVAFVGRDAVAIYRATVIESALRLYAKTGMRVNRAYTPAAMMRVAAEITGRKFKARDYLGAADALRAWRTDPVNVPTVIDHRNLATAPIAHYPLPPATNTRSDESDSGFDNGSQ